MITPVVTCALLLVISLGRAFSAGAQCLALRQLIAIGAAPLARAAPQNVAELPAPEWRFEGTVPRSHDVFWATTTKDGSGLARALVTLRTMQQSVDVLLKTADPACIRAVRAELKDLRLSFINVNCPGGCEAQRYDGTQFQTTIYSKMKGDYPFVVVVHPKEVAAVPAAPPAEAGPVSTSPRP